MGGVTNSDIAELLALEAESCTEALKGKALRRASRAAFLWPIEAAELLKANRSLTELNGVGPFISKVIQRWIDKPPAIPERAENRRDFVTLTEARAILAKDPKWQKSFKGDLQMHTTWSDGSGSVLRMAQEAVERGYSYIGITDHSKALKIAGGINEEELAEQGEEIDAVNAALKEAGKKLTVLKSIELNLTPEGKGDLEDEALAKLDVVVGSFHSALRRIPDQTERYVAALENPTIDILGHPRGRVYNYRLGLNADWEKIFARAAELGKAIEIDSYPDRQDLNHDLLVKARKAGCLISIDTDAHHPEQLGFIELGLAVALRAGIDPELIVNFKTARQLKVLFRKEKKQNHGRTSARH
jgi:histidinol phosphatase-like PHP family hydrolase